jgi:peptidyl-tRNA hydrolase, PTH1 family
MKVIVGLGNTGEKYLHTRHNTGFMFVNFLKNIMGFSGDFLFEKKFLSEILHEESFILVKPQTYMNSSGLAVFKILNFYKIDISDLILCYDDLDIEFGKWKISKGKSPRAHNGVNSVIEQFKSEDFWHVRVGILGQDYKYIKSMGKSIADDYILKDFSKEEFGGIYNVFGNVFDECRDKKIF